MKHSKAFTLIELVAVLIVLAIISIIIIPLVLNIIRKAKNSSNMRSIDGYGRAAEYAMANYDLKHIPYPEKFEDLKIDYKGNKVECEIERINPDHTIYLSKCKVNNRYVKDDKTIDGYYHFGKLKMTNEEYVDTYGKNLEDAVKDYHDKNNEYPSDYTTLEIPKLDKEVECDVSINYDGTVYLENCKLDGINVVDENNETYVYGKYVPSYVIGDMIEFAGSNWYVIEDSNTMKDYVTLLKETVLTNTELGEYALNDTYDTMGYYWSDTCHWKDMYGYTERDDSGCSNIDYSNSKIREMLEQIYMPTLGESNLKEIDGYKIRIIKPEEIISNLGWSSGRGTYATAAGNNVPTWVYQNFGDKKNNVSRYWTMEKMLLVRNDGMLAASSSDWRYGKIYGVRPVINLYKDSINS